MAEPARIVVDTNVLVSRLLRPRSVPAQAMTRALDIGKLPMSEATFHEIAEMLARPKFDPYVTEDERRAFVLLLEGIAERVPVLRRVAICRDPKDDKFVELALDGSAHCIVSGDQDLLSLERVGAIVVMTPAAFLEWEWTAG